MPKFSKKPRKRSARKANAAVDKITLAMPDFFYEFTGTDYLRSPGPGTYACDCTGVFEVSAKFKLLSHDFQSPQLLGYICSFAGTKQRLGVQTDGSIYWQDDSSGNFTNLNAAYNVWYLIKVRGDGAGNLTGELYALDGSSYQIGTKTDNGTVGSAERMVIGDFGGVVRPINAYIADVRFIEAGVLKVHYPMNDYRLASSTDAVTGVVSPITGPGRWHPTAFHGDWDADWTTAGDWGTNTKDFITRDQFRGETGVEPPADHAGPILKLVVNDASKFTELNATPSGMETDISSWVTFCPRYYLSLDSYDRWRFPTGGQIQFGWRDVPNNIYAHTRGAGPSLSGLTAPGLNYPIFDPNTQGWLPRDDGNGNWGMILQNFASPPVVFDDTDIAKLHMNNKVDAGSEPATLYVFDLLKDVGRTNDKIYVAIGWDDSQDDVMDVHTVATTHSIKNVVWHTSVNIGGGGKLSGPEIQTLKASGLWEFSNHSETHADYETLSSAQVKNQEVGVCRQDMIERGFLNTDSIRTGSCPYNANYKTADGVYLPDLFKSMGHRAYRKGHYQFYSEKIGLGNPFEIGAYSMGQSNNGLWDYTEISAWHVKMKAMGCSYVMYGHQVDLSSPEAPTGNQIGQNSLDSYFADLRTDIDNGEVEVLFFGEWAKKMGAKF